MATSDKIRYAPGDIIVVPFPYSDQFAEKRRPALVVSNAKVQSQGYIWVVMITSALHSRFTNDLEIDDLAQAGLSSRSIVRPVKITNVEPARVIRRAGRLKPEQAAIVFDVVKSFIGR
ncbi:type II toxin-antitoxin system PemK/MazF family toxin [Methylocystis sp. 9N]|uniref:Type II toxin-antitoxin system PemK/MazF family toxin n=1 Tax=Methylocystis borbori TaxID=3118750 RepID=A0ABU7XH02_9HYPH